MTILNSAWPLTACSRALTGFALAGLLTACGGGGSSSSADQPIATAGEEEQTKLMLSLTDAEGDFLTYVVDVTSITLNRANGAEVEVLSEATTVDFAQYVDISELLAVRSVPVGRYDSISLNIDFSEAQVTVQSDSGTALEAELFDTEGAALTAASIQVDIGSEDAFTLNRGVLHHVTLDFDLDASNTITIDGSEASLTVAPIWIADPIQEDPKPLRLRGALAEVDEAESSFELSLRPFRKRQDRFGEATVFVDTDTVFEINEAMVANESGLAELSALLNENDDRVPVITMGIWDRDTRQYVATEVLAGSSVPWSESDILRGTVIARSGNDVTVRGALMELSDGRFLFNDDVTLLLGEATTVLKRGAEEANLDDISVGSLLRVVGTVQDDRTIDASAGTVRILQGSVAGSVIAESPLQLDLASINGRRAALFDFAGTGVSPDVDADANQYEIATGSLSLDSIVNGDPVRVRGFTRAFGQAPEDFDAHAVIDASQVKGVLRVSYGPNSEATPLSINEASQLQLDLSDSRASLVRAGIPVSLPEDQPILIDSSESAMGIFSIASGRSVEVFTQYDDFITALNRYINAETPIFRFTAQGEYDSLLNTISSKRMQVHFVESQIE